MEKKIDKLISFILKFKRKIFKYDKFKADYIENVKKLIDKGLIIGKNVTIETNVIIDEIYPYLISIGDNSSIASNVRIFAHDDAPVKFTGNLSRLGKVEIKENCFIGDSSIILPGVTIGPNVVVASGSVVNKDIPPNSCVAGVPARFYAKFDDVMKGIQERAKSQFVIPYHELHNEHMSEEFKEQVREAVFKEECFVRGKPESSKLYILWNPTA